MIRTEISEDRLTEMFAALLENDAEVRSRFVKAIDRPPAADHAIATQRIVQSGRIDLELRLEHAAGRSVVWVEAKETADEGPGQLRRYAHELRDRYGPGVGQLVALARRGDPLLESARQPLYGVDPPAQTALPKTWQEVADLIDDAARSGGSKRWRLEAARLRTDRVQRDRADFIDYLRHRKLAMDNEPLTLTDGIVAAGAEDLLRRDGRIEQLLQRAIGALDGYEYEGGWGSTASYLSAWQGQTLRSPTVVPAVQAVDPEATWLATIYFAPSDRWERRDPLEQPFFGAGWTVTGATERVRQVLMRAQDVPQRHGGAAVVVPEGDEEPRIVRRLYLAELVARGATLFEQADELGRWAADSVRELAAWTPRDAVA